MAFGDEHQTFPGKNGGKRAILVDSSGNPYNATNPLPVKLNAFDWIESVLSEIDFTTAEPAAPTLGDRYINTTTGLSSVTSQSVTKDYVYEWNGTSWSETIPTEGTATWVEDINVLKIYNGSAWVTFGSTVNHAFLLNLNWAAAGHTIDAPIDMNFSGLESIYENTITVAKSGGDYTTIQAAITAAVAGDTILVYPGTYSESLAFSANDVNIFGAGNFSDTVVITQADATVLDFGTTTGCTISRVKLQMTAPTLGTRTAINSDAAGVGIVDKCDIEMTVSASITGDQPHCVSSNGSITLNSCTIDYTNTGAAADGVDIKAPLETNGSGVLIVDDCTVTVVGSGTSLCSAIAYNHAATGVVTVSECKAQVTETTSNAYGLIIGGSLATHEFYFNEIRCQTSALNKDAIAFDVNDTVTLRTAHNIIRCTDGGGTGASYAFDIAVGATVNSFLDAIEAADEVINLGTYNFVNTPSIGNIQVSGSYLNMFDETYTIAPRGGDYQSIQAALDAHPDAGALFIIQAGTYANETVNFTANDQTLIGAGDIDSAVITNTTTICDFTTFTGCAVENLCLKMTATTNVHNITGSGSLEINNCIVETNASGTLATGGPTCIYTTGTVKIRHGFLNLNSTVVSAGQVKKAIFLDTGADVLVERVDITLVCSGNILGTATAYGTSTGVIKFARNEFDISDDDALVTAALYLGGSGSQELIGNAIICTNNGAGNTAYGYYFTTGTTMDVRSMFNYIKCTSSAGNARPWNVGANVTLTSMYDTTVTAQPGLGAGTVIYSGALADGDLDASNDMNAGNNLTVGNTADIVSTTTSGGFIDDSGDGLEIPTPADLASNTMVKTIISASDYGIDYYIPASGQGRLNFVGAGTTYGYIEINGTNAGDFLMQDSTATNAIVWDASTAGFIVTNSTNFLTINGSNGYYTTTDGSTTYHYTAGGMRVPTNNPAFISDALPLAGLWFTSGGIGNRFAWRNTAGAEQVNLMLSGGICLGSYAGVTAPPVAGITCPGNVGIGIASPNASAILDLTSTTGALLLPRMTTTQRNVLTAVNGMRIYNTTTNQFEGYQAGAWVNI